MNFDSQHKHSPDDSSHQPKYQRLLEDWIHRIQSGSWAEGEKLPGEFELQDMFAVSRSTVRKVLDQLEVRGLIHREQGRGTFVGASRKTQPGGTLGLLIPSMSNELYTNIIRGIEDSANTRLWTVFVGNTYGDRNREIRLIQSMIQQKIQGLIIDPTHGNLDTPGTESWRLLKSLPIPLVLLNNQLNGIEVSQVRMDDKFGGYLAAKHILELGHRRIAYIYQETVQAALLRKAGIEEAKANSQLENVELNCLGFDGSTKTNADAVQGLTHSLLQSQSRPQAILYYNDESALEGYKAILESGLSIPRDISVMGFDNTNSGVLARPPLSTIDNAAYLSGRWAADIVFEHLANLKESTRCCVTIQPELRVRQSTAKPAS